MGQSALINWIEIGKDITSSEIVSALGFTPISSNEIPVALPNPYALLQLMEQIILIQDLL